MLPWRSLFFKKWIPCQDIHKVSGHLASWARHLKSPLWKVCAWLMAHFAQTLSCRLNCKLTLIFRIHAPFALDVSFSKLVKVSQCLLASNAAPMHKQTNCCMHALAQVSAYWSSLVNAAMVHWRAGRLYSLSSIIMFWMASCSHTCTHI